MLKRKQSKKKKVQTQVALRDRGTCLQATVLSYPSMIKEFKNLENRQFLSLSLYGEGGMRVVDDGGPGGLCVELPLF